MKVINKESLINEEIKEKEVRVIGSNNEQLGVMPTREALSIAEEKDLDLVLIAKNAKPPVCKITNYGKFIYEQTKRDKDSKKKQKVVNIKEVRLSPNIEEHDIEIKANNARRFLKNEDKVKVTLKFRGRQVDCFTTGHRILDLFFSKVEDVASIEKPAKMEGKTMILILAPKRA